MLIGIPGGFDGFWFVEGARNNEEAVILDTVEEMRNGIARQGSCFYRVERVDFTQTKASPHFYVLLPTWRRTFEAEVRFFCDFVPMFRAISRTK